ncbi:MAG: hypothetical protein JW967_09485 [Dehalococcoidales bacterium]|nr:hypothetical protein [Dehalococcoidales bacterium]
MADAKDNAAPTASHRTADMTPLATSHTPPMTGTIPAMKVGYEQLR